MNKLYRLLLIVCCFVLLGAVNTASFKVTGIKGDLLLNVKSRLGELYQDKPIAIEPLENVRLQVNKAMYPFGFFNAQITFGHTDAGNRLLIQIVPGPQMLITSLRVRITGEGAENSEIKQALHDMPIAAGQPLNNKLYEEAKDNLISAAEHQGFLHASFSKAEMLIDRTRYVSQITLDFNTGPQYYFGQIRFDPTYISPELLHRYVPFTAGQPYSTDQVLALNTNLSASGYFNSVVVKPQINDKSQAPIFIHLQPKKRISYSLGVGYGTDTGPRGRAGIDVIPVNRAGHKFNAIVQGSLKENALLAQYLIPGRNPVTDNYSINGSFSNLNYSSGYSNSLLLSIAQQHAETNYQRVISLNGLDERYNYTGQPKTTKLLLFPKAALTWRKVSDQLFSPSGYNLSVYGLAGNKFLLSQVNFAQAVADMKAAITVDPVRTRFFLHLTQGVTQINNVNDLPLSLAMLMGGADNLKAYSYNSIGPGKLMSFVSMEIQKETFEKWYFIGFVDTGDVYKPAAKAFQYDAGIGLMWVSPVGPIKIGVAQAVDNHLQRIQGRNPKLVINMGPDL